MRDILKYEESPTEIAILGLIDTVTASDVVIPDTINGKPVTIIEEEAFRGKRNLKNVILGKNIRVIEDRAFANSGLAKIFLNKDIRKVGEGTFMNCEELVDVNWECSIPVSDFCFSNCKSLKSFDFSNVTGIGLHSFSDCGLEEICIKPNIQFVGAWAFHDCKNLKNVEWLSDCEIPALCFYVTPNLKSFDFFMLRRLETVLLLGVD